MTTKEVEQLLGRKVDPKWLMVLLGDGRLLRREVDGWEPYPPYPDLERLRRL